MAAVEPDAALPDLRSRVSSLETRALADTTPEAIAGLRERLAVVETRSPVPGPAGRDGINGADGQKGQDGRDGVGFDSIGAVYDDAGRLSIKFGLGDEVKLFAVPGWVDRGVYRAGDHYKQGDGVTWGGSFWIAQTDTDAKPGEAGADSRAWRLSVKAGRDGKPAVKVGGGS